MGSCSVLRIKTEEDQIMRRKDREMDEAFAKQVIDKAKFGVLSVCDNRSNTPYSLPLSLVRNEGTLYFHSAKEGTKVELISRIEKARIVFVGEVQVPDLYSNTELDEMVKDKEKTIQLISRVFTTEFESAIVEGKVSEVIDWDEKVLALKLICEKYTPDKMAYFDYAVEAGEKYTKVYRIEIESLTAKRKKYDQNGDEMKWGRL